MSAYECAHCGAEYSDTEEEAYLQHLADKHKDDLTRIDRKHIDQHRGIDLSDEPSTKDLVLQTAIITVGLILSGALLYMFIL